MEIGIDSFAAFVTDAQGNPVGTAQDALQELLEPIARHGVSLTRIESRPSRKRKWDYVFFLDLLGHAEDAPVAAALAELQGRTSLLRVLGSYPRSVL